MEPSTRMIIKYNEENFLVKPEWWSLDIDEIFFVSSYYAIIWYN